MHYLIQICQDQVVTITCILRPYFAANISLAVLFSPWGALVLVVVDNVDDLVFELFPHSHVEIQGLRVTLEVTRTFNYNEVVGICVLLS